MVEADTRLQVGVADPELQPTKAPAALSWLLVSHFGARRSSEGLQAPVVYKVVGCLALGAPAPIIAATLGNSAVILAALPLGSWIAYRSWFMGIWPLRNGNLLLKYLWRRREVQAGQWKRLAEEAGTIYLEMQDGELVPVPGLHAPPFDVGVRYRLAAVRKSAHELGLPLTPLDS